MKAPKRPGTPSPQPLKPSNGTRDDGYSPNANPGGPPRGTGGVPPK